MKLPEMQSRLSRFRLKKSDALKIAKEMEKQGMIVLDMSRGVNQHLQIKVCSKGVASFYAFSAITLFYCAMLSLGAMLVCL